MESAPWRSACASVRLATRSNTGCAAYAAVDQTRATSRVSVRTRASLASRARAANVSRMLRRETETGLASAVRRIGGGRRAIHGLAQAGDVDRLDQVRVHPGLPRALEVGSLAVAGQRHDARPGHLGHGTQLSRHFVTVHHR